MYKPVSFMPQNFGGYTLSMILCGLFLGYTSLNEWWYFIASVVMYFCAMYFYAKDNTSNN